MKERFIAIGVLTLASILLAINLAWKNVKESQIVVASFEECVEAGFPVMESMPRQCRDGAGTLFIEMVTAPESEPQIVPVMSEQSARETAKASDVCREGGMVGKFEAYNTNSGTWWFTLSEKKTTCAPACVVYDQTGKTEINWRCTGLQ